MPPLAVNINAHFPQGIWVFVSKKFPGGMKVIDFTNSVFCFDFIAKEVKYMEPWILQSCSNPDCRKMGCKMPDDKGGK